MNEGASLEVVLEAVHGAVVELVVAPPTGEVQIRSVALIDADDLSAHIDADLCLIVGVPEAQVVTWLDDRALARDLPRAVMTKTTAVSPALRQAARHSGVALASVHPQARWERLLSMIRSVLDRSQRQLEPVGEDTDLYELARTVASLTKGMVSIEDELSHVLAYSASDDAADELRTLSILGREGPRDYLRRLREMGVFDRIERSDDVVEVPPDENLGIRRRLVVGVRSIPDDAGKATVLGSIWIQEGQHPFSSDSEGVLRGAASVAARLVTRIRDAPTNEAVQIQRLLGARGGGVDVPALAAALSISAVQPAAVVGFEPIGDARKGLTSSLRLHASAFHRSSLATAIGDRVYVLFPGPTSDIALESWTREVVTRVENGTGVALRAVVAGSVPTLSDAAAARFEVDRVLDRTSGDSRVTTLEQSRTTVLLGEIVELVAHHDQLIDPRIATLQRYDDKNDGVMRQSLEAYLAEFGDVRAAAGKLQVHPNTLRYRIKRVEGILGVDLGDPDERVLIELQLRIARR
ncbi:PucR family transcriptional regulator [Rhodococcoides kyotonense]|uniref:PucR C-terminal helix-turn-helix domain-containing protein n=1 Tax=Rhodococcoides kyotonense TaxID=398843 RepID=A0A239DYJ6_9NOCA|nr:PucR family transcriptional regulator [Rhodococcus kyotonensis]SNS37329.1 PucR C-terminal helix-turn-helix domain-containing protein [Rhodococcus kyotonensis]